ncbi:uncharacterized protein [Arachis hypogaea]|uniref:uncharacterized protein n=1 Tax=Arachis hypogaea TaxID=3818 RepID=UPI003B2143BB
MLQWVVELSKCDLKYETRTIIKSQYLTDFLAEYTGVQRDSTVWHIFVDGSSNKARSGARIILENEEETWIELLRKFEFPTSNYQAKYEAMLAGLRLAKEVRVAKIIVFSDSQVITTQLNETYQAKDPNMKKYLEETLEQLTQSQEAEVRHITRELNS